MGKKQEIFEHSKRDYLREEELEEGEIAEWLIIVVFLQKNLTKKIKYERRISKMFLLTFLDHRDLMPQAPTRGHEVKSNILLA